MTLNLCPECQRLRRHIDILRDRNGELELRLEGALQKVRRAAAAARNESKNGRSRTAHMGPKPGPLGCS